MTVAEFLERVSATELDEWKQYAQIKAEDFEKNKPKAPDEKKDVTMDDEGDAHVDR